MSATDKTQEEEWVDPYPKKKRHPLRWVTLALFVFALYALSVGPFLRLAYERKISIAAVETIELLYEPLNFLTRVCPPLDKFFRWYESQWVPRNS